MQNRKTNGRKPPIKEFVVLGLGRFGRLWVECVSLWGRVYGYDPAITTQKGSNRDSSVEFPKNFTLLADQNALDEVVQRCAAIFFCVPISLLKNTLEELQSSLKRRLCTHNTDLQTQNYPLWLMDTCSVKVEPLAQLEEAVCKIELAQSPQGGESPFRVLGLHPMFGPDSATSKELEGRRLVLCPSGNTGSVLHAGQKEAQGRDRKIYEQELRLWEKRFAALGLQTILMSADEHDLEAARTQGLTHLLGRVLDAFGIAESPIATAGYQALCQLREQTCHDTWQLFLDLQQQNGYTVAMRKRLQAAFTSICAVLEQQPENTGHNAPKQNGALDYG